MSDHLGFAMHGGGILIRKFPAGYSRSFGEVLIRGLNLPSAVLIWIMIYPMMMKIDFGKHPSGIIIFSGNSWLIKPFLMFGWRSCFLCHISSFHPGWFGAGFRDRKRSYIQRTNYYTVIPLFKG
jgi:ACR3 family arsenite efflux pump ArsB